MDVVSFETAKKLKEVGFPQPEPAVGQAWWIEIGTDGTVPPALIQIIPNQIELARLAEIHFDGISILDSFRSFYGGGSDGYYFAPTATDILKEASNNMMIGYSPFGGFEVYTNHRCLVNGIPDAQHANPAEACAAAWLELKKGN
jgi:hypothetical protein